MSLRKEMEAQYQDVRFSDSPLNISEGNRPAIMSVDNLHRQLGMEKDTIAVNCRSHRGQAEARSSPPEFKTVANGTVASSTQLDRNCIRKDQTQIQRKSTRATYHQHTTHTTFGSLNPGNALEIFLLFIRVRSTCDSWYQGLRLIVPFSCRPVRVPRSTATCELDIQHGF